MDDDDLSDVSDGEMEETVQVKSRPQRMGGLQNISRTIRSRLGGKR
jgi:hypothetical protein